ncbi:hypothetical protein BST61_g9974 [Cercospora zeina]
MSIHPVADNICAPRRRVLAHSHYCRQQLCTATKPKSLSLVASSFLLTPALEEHLHQLESITRLFRSTPTALCTTTKTACHYPFLTNAATDATNAFIFFISPKTNTRSLTA